jgi:4-amino-4-deoxy-L-arabinose transferase-like glycosyltransferase
MTQPQSPLHEPRRALFRFLAFLVLALATRAVVLGIGVVDLDEASYATAAREMLRGSHLYADVADHKPPLVFAWYALAQWLLGPTMQSVRLLTDLTILPLTALGLSAFFDHDRRGLLAGVAWLVYGAAFIGHDMLAVNCEILMMLPLAWALVLLRRPRDLTALWRPLLAGGLVGIATLFKYQACFWLPVPVVAALFAGRESRSGRVLRVIIFLGAGFAVPLLAAYFVFAVRGLGQDFLYWNLLHNLDYLGATVSLAEGLKRAAASLLPFLVVTAPLWIGVSRLRATGTDGDRRALVLGALVLSLLGVIPGLRFYPHYVVPVYVPLALAAAPWLALQVRRPLSRSAWLVLAWSAAMLLGFTASTFALYRRTDVYPETRPVFAAMAREMHSRACRSDGPLFVWGYAPQFYYEANLPVASRFLFVDRTLTGHVSGGEADPRLVRQQHWDWLMADLERSQPDFVVDAGKARLSRWDYPIEDFPRLVSFMREGYLPVATVDGATLWQRRGCAATSERSLGTPSP